MFNVDYFANELFASPYFFLPLVLAASCCRKSIQECGRVWGPDLGEFPNVLNPIQLPNSA